MYEAVKPLKDGEDFLLITINEDSVPDYASEFSVIRDLTDGVIIARTSGYTLQKRLTALQMGVNFYESFAGDAGCNVKVALSLLGAQNRWNGRTPPSANILLCGDVFMSLSHKRAFINDKELVLTKSEFSILSYFMESQGVLLSYEQIFQRVWGYDSNRSTSDMVWSSLKRLRTKLAAVSLEYGRMIVNQHGLGYRFISD